MAAGKRAALFLAFLLSLSRAVMMASAQEREEISRQGEGEKRQEYVYICVKEVIALNEKIHASFLAETASCDSETMKAQEGKGELQILAAIGTAQLVHKVKLPGSTTEDKDKSELCQVSDAESGATWVTTKCKDKNVKVLKSVMVIELLTLDRVSTPLLIQEDSRCLSLLPDPLQNRLTLCSQSHIGAPQIFLGTPMMNGDEVIYDSSRGILMKGCKESVTICKDHKCGEDEDEDECVFHFVETLHKEEARPEGSAPLCVKSDNTIVKDTDPNCEYSFDVLDTSMGPSAAYMMVSPISFCINTEKSEPLGLWRNQFRVAAKAFDFAKSVASKGTATPCANGVQLPLMLPLPPSRMKSVAFPYFILTVYKQSSPDGPARSAVGPGTVQFDDYQRDFLILLQSSPGPRMNPAVGVVESTSKDVALLSSALPDERPGAFLNALCKFLSFFGDIFTKDVRTCRQYTQLNIYYELAVAELVRPHICTYMCNSDFVVSLHDDECPEPGIPNSLCFRHLSSMKDSFAVPYNPSCSGEGCS